MNKTTTIHLVLCLLAGGLCASFELGCSKSSEPRSSSGSSEENAGEKQKAQRAPLDLAAIDTAKSDGGKNAPAKPVGEAACKACRDRHCRSVEGADLVAGCLEKINPNFGAKADDAQFLADCRSVVACARKTHCAYDAARQASACYCGAWLVDKCAEAGPAPDAPCRKEWEAATRSKDNKEIMVRFSDPAYPAGWAFNLLECDRQFCPEVCTAPLTET